jgi:predicted O-methyltransferase YrrM
MQKLWAHVEHYFEDLLTPENAALSAVIDTNHSEGLPSIDVPALMGKFLGLMVRISGARRILEIGTLGGYSTIWLARALPADGQLITLEIDPRHAKVAQANLDQTGVADRVEIRLGPAADSMRALHASGTASFDLIFIDADKQGLPEYLKLSLNLSRPGTVIIADNVVRDGKVIQAGSTDPNVQGVRAFLDLAAAEPRLSATALPMVGARGYDGFAMAVVLS